MTSILVIAYDGKNKVNFQYNIADHLEDYITSEQYENFVLQQIAFFKSLGEIHIGQMKYPIVKVERIPTNLSPSLMRLFEGDSNGA